MKKFGLLLMSVLLFLGVFAKDCPRIVINPTTKEVSIVSCDKDSAPIFQSSQSSTQ